jgi:F0F1-type ATP synthase membrane subunit c/vacuolar-type H+-ATPase subunit K
MRLTFVGFQECRIYRGGKPYKPFRTIRPDSSRPVQTLKSKYDDNCSYTFIHRIGIHANTSRNRKRVGGYQGWQCHRRRVEKEPEAFGSYLLLSALPGTQGLYGFAGFFIINNQGVINEQTTMLQGIAIIAAGLMLGVVGLIRP